MIILDTNVVSELMRGAPNEAVVRWVNTQVSTSLCITSITQAEILYGIFSLPKGKRRDGFARAAEELFELLFRGRVLGFGSEATQAYAMIAAARRRAGKPISAFDAQIAAIARTNDAKLATRNVEDFEGCSVGVVNPWVA